MILKNWKNMILGYLASSSNSYALVRYWDNSTTEGTQTKVVPISNTSTNPSGSYQAFVYGCGTTKESEYDYMLENRLTSLTINSFSMTKNYVTDISVENVNFAYRAVVSNNTDENITISEIGIVRGVPDTPSSCVLLYRKTFEPITLAPNDTYTFAIDLR